MTNLLHELFLIRGIPHGYCFAWEPQLLWTMVISNALVAAAYLMIALALNHFIRLQPGVPYKWIFVLFSAFIFFCGLTHVISIINIWRPMYQLDGVIMSVTALFRPPLQACCIRWCPRHQNFSMSNAHRPLRLRRSIASFGTPPRPWSSRTSSLSLVRPDSGELSTERPLGWLSWTRTATFLRSTDHCWRFWIFQPNN